MIVALPFHNLGTATTTNVAHCFLPVAEYLLLSSRNVLVKVRDKDLEPWHMRVGKYKLSKPRR